MIALIENNIESYQRFINGNVNSDTLNILANNKDYMQFLASMLDDSSKVNTVNTIMTKEIYKEIFSDKKPKDYTVKISQECYIDDPQHYKSLLIGACNLLSPYAKLD